MQIINCKTKDIIVDGFNLLYKYPHLEEFMYRNNLTKARNGLIKILNEYVSKSKKNITVYVDGKKEEGLNITKEKVGNINIVYTIDVTADYEIKKFVMKSRQPGIITVVSSDKEVIQVVKGCGAHFLKSEEFVQIINQVLSTVIEEKDEKQSDVNLSKNDIEYWSKIFEK